jgi:hypothetical protein
VVERVLELNREMGISHSEFHRLLPAAAPGFQISGNGVEIRVANPQTGQLMEIVLGPERQRRLGMLALPVTDVRLRLSGFEQDQLQAFLKRFDLAYQRGGG